MKSNRYARAYIFVLLIGFVSFFADLTYEGARSISGPYLALLGASAATVSIVSGLGECLGYGLRIISGSITDTTRLYWPITWIGYLINLLAVPCLAFVHSWEMACFWIVMERTGKAIRNPSRDAMLSFAANDVGRGWTFGVQGALDQLGAFFGPLFVMGFIYRFDDLRLSFFLLGIPVIITFSILAFAQYLYPSPRDFESGTIEIHPKTISKTFWIYFTAVSLLGAGYIDFPLIAYHLQTQHVSTQIMIPLIYAVAMGASAITAFISGRIFDKKGLIISVHITLVTAAYPLLTLNSSETLAVLGMFLWGVGLGGLHTVMSATVATLTHKDKRATSYGILYIGFGLSWFAGSIVLGLLYERSHELCALLSVALQLSAIPFFIWAARSQISPTKS